MSLTESIGRSEQDGEVALFSTPVETRSRLWLTFPASAIGHVAAIALIVSYGEFLANYPDPKFFPQNTQVQPFEVRFPQVRERISAPRLRKAARRQIARQPARISNPSPSRRVLELPQMPLLKPSDAILLQPSLPPDLAPKRQTRLPVMMFWSALNRPRPEKPFVVPALATPPPEPPKLNTPPKLEVPNQEVKLSDLRIAAARPVPRPFLPRAPSNVAPVRNSADAPRPQPVILASAPPLQGDAVNVLSLPKDATGVFDRIEIPAGNMITAPPPAPPEVALRDAAPGTATVGSADKGIEGAKGTERSAPPNSENVAGGTATRGTGTQPGGADGAKSGVGTSKAGEGKDTSTSGGIASGTARPTSPALPPASLHRIELPRNGDFEVVVVQSNVGDAYPETKGLLTGKPVYTAFIKVGGSKEWILQYCVPSSSDGPTRASGSVIQLGNPTPLKAPYPFVIIRPDLAWAPEVSRLVIHGFVNQQGKFEQLSVIGRLDSKDQDLLIGALSTWEFRPALRDGRPATVEVLLFNPPGESLGQSFSRESVLSLECSKLKLI